MAKAVLSLRPVGFVAVVVSALILVAVSVSAGGPVVSRGYELAFASGGSEGVIAAVRADGTHKRRVTTHPRGYADVEPAWAPGGRRIAFVRHGPNSETFVYVAHADGSHQIQLTAGRSPAWSRDGRRLAIVSGGEEERVVSVVSLDGRVTRIGAGDQPSWGGNNRLAYVRTTYGDNPWDPEEGPVQFRSEIVVTGADGRGARVIADDRPHGTDDGAIAYDFYGAPVWSPAGKTLAVTSELCDPDQYCYGTALRTIAVADGRELMRNSPVDAKTASPAWAPNGKTIALVGMDEENFSLEVVGADGTGWHRLMTLRHYHAASGASIAWSPDSRKVAFAAYTDDYGDLFVFIVGADGRGLKQLLRIQEPQGSALSWRTING